MKNMKSRVSKADLGTAYSPHKAAHYHKELDWFRYNKDLMVAPRQVQIDPFNPCNHDCGFCVYRYHKDDDINALFNVKDIIPLHKMMEIFGSCVEMGTKGVELTGGGEPTLHPQFIHILEGIDENKLELGLITNGCGPNWRKRVDEMAHFVGQGCWVRFSLDAATPETHYAIHRGAEQDFYTAIRSIRKTAYKKQPHTIVGVSFVVTRENYREIVDAAKLAKDLGADNIRYSAAIFEGMPNDYHEPHYVEARYLMEDAERFADKSFSVFTFHERMKFRTSYGNYEEGDRCFYSHLNAVIGADLNLYPCCVLKYRPKGVVASLKGKTFTEAWRGKARQKYYEKLDLEKGCVTCYLKPKNDFIKYLVSSDPLHLNFP